MPFDVDWLSDGSEPTAYSFRATVQRTVLDGPAFCLCTGSLRRLCFLLCGFSLRSRPGGSLFSLSLSLSLTDLSYSLFATVLSSDSCAMRLLLLFSLLSLLEQESAGFSFGGGFNDGFLKSALAPFVRRNFASRVFVVLVAVFVAGQSVSSIAVRFE